MSYRGNTNRTDKQATKLKSLCNQGDNLKSIAKLSPNRQDILQGFIILITYRVYINSGSGKLAV